MPQLMPFMWVYSIFMSLILLLMLVFLYYNNSLYNYMLEGVKYEFVNFKW